MILYITRFIKTGMLAIVVGLITWWGVNAALEPKARHLVVPKNHPFFSKPGRDFFPYYVYTLQGKDGLLQDATGRFIAFVDYSQRQTNDSVSLLILDFDRPDWEIQISVPCSNWIPVNTGFMWPRTPSLLPCDVTVPTLERKIRLGFSSELLGECIYHQNKPCSYRSTSPTSSPGILFVETREYLEPYIDAWPWARDLAKRWDVEKWVDNPEWNYKAELVNQLNEQTLWSHNSTYDLYDPGTGRSFLAVAGIILQPPPGCGPEYVLSQDKRSVLLKRITEPGLEFWRWEIKLHSLWWARGAGLAIALTVFLLCMLRRRTSIRTTLSSLPSRIETAKKLPIRSQSIIPVASSVSALAQ